MQLFDNLDEEVLDDIIINQKNVSIKISDEVTGFSKNIPHVDFGPGEEIPPLKVYLTKDNVSLIRALSATDIKGKYIRFYITVYALNGKIIFKKHDDKYYEAEVKWLNS